MSRHRAPSPPRSTMTVALTGAALGASVLLPATALAAPAHTPARPSADADVDGDSDDSGFFGDDSGFFGDDSGSDDSPFDGVVTADQPSGSADRAAGDGRVRAATRTQRATASERATPTRQAATRHDTDDRHAAAPRRTSPRHAHTRNMSSGEEQYRNGCRAGYIIDDCEQFDVTHLLRRGINPFQ